MSGGGGKVFKGKNFLDKWAENGLPCSIFRSLKSILNAISCLLKAAFPEQKGVSSWCGVGKARKIIGQGQRLSVPEGRNLNAESNTV